VIDVALLGEVEPDRLLLRSGARPGDVVMVTGDLGGAAAGLALLNEETERGSTGSTLAVSADDRREVLARLHEPVPRLGVAPLLRPLGATAGLDISDGLAGDARHLCDRSGVGVRIEAKTLPVAAATRAIARSLNSDHLSWAVVGGEDYELLFTADPRRADVLAATVARETGVRVTPVGVVTAELERVLVLPDGGTRPLAGGWRHFG